MTSVQLALWDVEGGTEIGQVVLATAEVTTTPMH